MQLSEIKLIYHKELSGQYPATEVDSLFYRAIEHYLKLERFVLVMQPNYTLTAAEETPLFQALSRLKTNEPIQYILGKAYFRDLELSVNKHTLIPRPETEELVQWVVDDLKAKDNSAIKILDIGTGSGCIAIALAKELPHSQVVAIDISIQALEVAQQNALDSQVEVDFIEADMLNLNLKSYFDIIVSNPPYVRELEKTEMHNNVKTFEPGSALFVPNDDALRFYEGIAAYSKMKLKPQGSLYLEINQYLSKETKKLYQNHSFNEILLKKDIFDNYRLMRCKL